MILYYAIISYCLSLCSSVDDMKRFIYEEPVSYEECLKVVNEMVIDTIDKREFNHSSRNRPISTLCVVKDSLKNIERYEVYIFGKFI
tara:strand:- start:480 stop:740 length:261 start_codon:yes stop_codon:yes gene_type:complete